MKKYKTVLADPPWQYKTPRAIVGNGGRGSHNALNIKQTSVLDNYSTMSTQDIMSLPVGSIVEDNAHLYLWCTNSFMVQAHDVARAWGFNPKTIITWVKVKSDNTPSMKTGYWYRSATEHILFAVRGRLRIKGPASPTVFFSPRLPHSVKPEATYELIEQQSQGAFIELFARRNRDGWDHWGNELKPTVDFQWDIAGHSEDAPPLNPRFLNLVRLLTAPVPAPGVGQKQPREQNPRS